MADGVKCFSVHSTEEVALSLARRLGVMESVESDEHRERMTKKWTRIVCKQANAGRGTV